MAAQRMDTRCVVRNECGEDRLPAIGTASGNVDGEAAVLCSAGPSPLSLHSQRCKSV